MAAFQNSQFHGIDNEYCTQGIPKNTPILGNHYHPLLLYPITYVFINKCNTTMKSNLKVIEKFAVGRALDSMSHWQMEGVIKTDV